MRPVGPFVLAGFCFISNFGCNQYPESYPPPEQRQPLTAEEAGEAKMFVAMNAPDAVSYFVRDIGGLEGGQWRWTGPEPTLHFAPDTARNLNFVLEFAVAGATFETTGPVTLTILLNDQLLGEVRCDAFGEKRFEKEVDENWIQAGEDTIVKVKVDPVWVSPADGTQLGVILRQAGFVNRESTTQ